MVSVSIKVCDRCQCTDSDEDPVRRVTIVGPRFDCCSTCRMGILLEFGTDPDDVKQFVEEQNQPGAVNGRYRQIAIGRPAEEAGSTDEAAPTEPVEPETAAKPKRSRKAVDA